MLIAINNVSHIFTDATLQVRYKYIRLGKYGWIMICVDLRVEYEAHENNKLIDIWKWLQYCSDLSLKVSELLWSR